MAAPDKLVEVNSRSLAGRFADLVKVGRVEQRISSEEKENERKEISQFVVLVNGERRPLQHHGTALLSCAVLRRRDAPMLGSTSRHVRRARAREGCKETQSYRATNVPRRTAQSDVHRRRAQRQHQEAPQRFPRRNIPRFVVGSQDEGYDATCRRASLASPTHHGHALVQQGAWRAGRRLCAC